MLDDTRLIRCDLDENCDDWSKHRPTMSDGFAYDPRMAAHDLRAGFMTQQEFNEYCAEGMRKIREAHGLTH